MAPPDELVNVRLTVEVLKHINWQLYLDSCGDPVPEELDVGAVAGRAISRQCPEGWQNRPSASAVVIGLSRAHWEVVLRGPEQTLALGDRWGEKPEYLHAARQTVLRVRSSLC